MSDLAAPDVGAPQSASTESSPVLQIPKDPEQYAEWRQTGKLPGDKQDKQPKDADSEPAKESADGEEPEEKHAPAPEAGSKQERRRDTAADRLQEILGDLKRAGLSPSELKTFKRELQQQQQPQAQTPQTSVNPPAQAQQPQPEPLKEPKLEDFKTWEEFQAADRKYFREMARQEAREEFRQQLAQQAQAAAAQAAGQRLADAKQRYGEEAESSIVSAARQVFSDQQIPPVIKAIVNDSPVIADLLYVMGSNQSDFDQFLQLAKTNPGEALRKAVLLEQLVKDELQKQSSSNGATAERDESGQFVSKKPPAKKVSEAPPPASEVSSRSSPPKDASQAAFERGDFRAFRNEENRKEMVAKRGL
jgi:hypothetical protein